MERFSEKVFPHLKEKFTSLIEEETKNDFLAQIVCLRASFRSEDEVNIFMTEFKKITHTSWMVYQLLKKPTRKIFHKTWICQHSSYKKMICSQRNAMCEAKVDIVIKKVNRGTAKNDVFLKHVPPLPCIIKIHLCHTHHTDTFENLKMLRVADETRNQFFKYFSMDLGPADAKHLHESKLLIVEKATRETLADASQNPTMRQVTHLYDCWRKSNRSKNSENQDGC